MFRKIKNKLSAFSLLFMSVFLAGNALAAGWKVDSYGNIKSARSSVLLSAGETSNCRMSITSTTFSILGWDGNALSNSNPCVVAVNSSTPGKVDLISFTSAVSFTFGATSDTDGNLFGITDANWSNNLPAFLGIITDGTNYYFTLSRLPFRVSGSASTDVCQKGDTDCDAQGDVMILTTGLTLSSWTSKNITPIGWFDATYATTGGAWTFAITAKNGFNRNVESVIFSMVTGQNGAASGKYLLNNGGTAPTFTLSNSYIYKVYWTGDVLVSFRFDNTSGGTLGSGVVGVEVATPYIFTGISANDRIKGSGLAHGVSLQAICISEINAQTSFVYLTYSLTAATTTSVVNNSDMNQAVREINGTLTFPAL